MRKKCSNYIGYIFVPAWKAIWYSVNMVLVHFIARAEGKLLAKYLQQHTDSPC